MHQAEVQRALSGGQGAGCLRPMLIFPLLSAAGAGTPVLIKGRRSTLTARSTWLYFEVRWEEGEEAGELTRARGTMCK
jgi:hypothetical protein